MGGSIGGSKGAAGFDPRNLYSGFAHSLLGRNAHQRLGGSEGGIFGELEDTIETSIRERPNNPFLQALSSTGGLEQAQQNILRRGQTGPRDLRSQALNAVAAGSNAASLVARGAAGGRGGLAFTGAAGDIAARAASSIAPQIQSSLSGALNTFNTQQGQLETGVASTLANVLQRGATNQFNVTEQRIFRDEDLRIGAKERINELLAGIASGGISGSGGSARTPGRSFNIQGGATFKGGGGE